ncbi:hypothetical protein SO694_00006554 [Aureococcus anophagefferens]|uniref:Kinesin motor domain-containing protein n=1 Tax=Aureococcus anophagefferens TaxID=44056 RepID=A0ABR1GAQ3_AURAN
MYDAVSCEGGVWERLAECVEAPVRQLVPLNKSWAALARDDQSALWRVLLRRLPGRRGVHAPCDGDVVRCGEARTWRDAFEGLETARYCWEAGGGPARRVFRITVAVRFRPTVRDAGGDDDAAAKVTMPLHQRLAAMRAGCEGAFDRRAALRKVLCENQNRSPASDFGAVVEKRKGAPAPKKVELAKASSADRSAAVLRVDDAEKEILTIAPGCGLRSFRFDDVFEAARGQAFVYDAVARPLVCDLVNLKNGTLFAFGQTGSGKTHSVFGGDGGGADARGVVPRMLAEILGAAKALERFAPKLAMSYVEIDGDELTDLLKDDAKVAQNAAAAQRWVLEGHAAVHVESLDGALALLDAGHARKKRAATRMNERSSRAHAVLVLTLTRTLSDGGRRSASLFVADLGGSEQLKRSKADADITKAAGKANDDDEGAGWAEYYAQRSRLQEAQKINLGLFALKRVVHALRRGSKFVPWMDSKLTMLLRPGLGGGARTACLVCAAPEPRTVWKSTTGLGGPHQTSELSISIKSTPRNALETVHALRFGEQCGALETEQQGGSAFTKAIEALNAKIAAVQKAIEAKERWEERARVVTSKIGTYDDMENETWGGQFEKVGKKWKRAESTTDHATVTHAVVGRVLVGAEAERRDLEALLGQKRALIAHAA